MADITPVTREEIYLAKAGGQDVPVPSAVTREEYYLEKLSNDSVVVPTPVTRREKFLYFACGGEIDLPSEDKMTRLERLIAKAGGMDVATPTAITRLEKFWANVEGGWKIAELTGTLPMTFRSNGTALINYRIFGTAEGVGERTEQLFTDAVGKQVITAAAGTTLSTGINNPMTLAAGRYTIHYYQSTSMTSNTRNTLSFLTVATGVQTYESGANNHNLDAGWYSWTFDIPNDDRYQMRIWISNASDEVKATSFILTKGETATPTEYIPYGYKLPLTITSGTESKDTDIFIGDSKLLSGDYVDYETGKIVRNGTPQDPPLPFPALETFKGENTLDSTETLGQVTITGKIKEVE